MYVLYSQTAATLAMSFHYFFIGFDFNVFYLLQEVAIIVLVTLISYFFIVEIGKITQRQSKNMIFTVPLLGFNIIYAAGIIISGIVLSVQEIVVYQCKSWIWLFTACSGTVSGLVLCGFSMFLRRVLKSWAEYSASRVSKGKLWQLWGFSIIVLTSYLTTLIDIIYKIKSMKYCYDYTDDLAANAILFISIRLVTHFSCIFYSIYIFWPRNRAVARSLLTDSREFDIISPQSPTN